MMLVMFACFGQINLGEEREGEGREGEGNGGAGEGEETANANQPQAFITRHGNEL